MTVIPWNKWTDALSSILIWMSSTDLWISQDSNFHLIIYSLHNQDNNRLIGSMHHQYRDLAIDLCLTKHEILTKHQILTAGIIRMPYSHHSASNLIRKIQKHRKKIKHKKCMYLQQRNTKPGQILRRRAIAWCSLSTHDINESKKKINW